MSSKSGKRSSPSGIVLREIAYARSGDKGSSANIAVFARSPKHYPYLCRRLTAAVVRRHFRGLGAGKIERYEVPNLDALNFVLHDILAGGGSTSLRIDAQGKALGQAILEMRLPA